MGRRLVGYVPIHDGDQTTWYGPDDDVPADVAEKIGEHAWVDDDDVEDDDVEESEQPGPTGPTPPPMGGAGSGVDAWLDYADELGVEVDVEDPKREDVVAAIKAAGHPVE